MRHTGAGLAIPDFPLMFGRIVPDHWSPAITVHFAHRAGAVIVAASALGTISTVWSHRRQHPELFRPALILAVLVVAQATLGALTIVSRRDPWINSFHVVGGALVLTTSLVITLRAWRAMIEAGVVRLKPDTTEKRVAPVRSKPDTTEESVAPVRLKPDTTEKRVAPVRSKPDTTEESVAPAVPLNVEIATSVGSVRLQPDPDSRGLA